jgi:hypothetical protein
MIRNAEAKHMCQLGISFHIYEFSGHKLHAGEGSLYHLIMEREIQLGSLSEMKTAQLLSAVRVNFTSMDQTQALCKITTVFVKRQRMLQPLVTLLSVRSRKALREYFCPK